jgi:hypothetical protein
VPDEPRRAQQIPRSDIARFVSDALALDRLVRVDMRHATWRGSPLPRSERFNGRARQRRVSQARTLTPIDAGGLDVTQLTRRACVSGESRIVIARRV